jgi:NTE family protein
VAHIGVLEVLHRENIPIDFIVGTSMGGILGTVYALGYPPERIAERMSHNVEGNNIFNMNLFSARRRQRSLQEQLQDAIANKTFADTHIPVTLMTVDMIRGVEVPLHEGKLMPALLATTAVPGVFPPVEINGMQLADGGVIDSLSTHVAYEQRADKIIAVDVYPALPQDNPWVDPISAIMGIELELPFGPFSLPSQWEKTPSIMAAIWRSVRVMTWHVHQERLKAYPPDILIRPAVDEYSSLDFKDIKGPIMAGRQATENQLPAIKALLGESATV